MSFSMAALQQLMQTGGAALRRYERLMREAEGAQAGSPAALAKSRFERDWQEDRAMAILEAEAEEHLRSMDEAGSA